MDRSTLACLTRARAGSANPNGERARRVRIGEPMQPMKQRQGELFAQGDIPPPAAELEERERRAIDRRIKDAHLPWGQDVG